MDEKLRDLITEALTAPEVRGAFHQFITEELSRISRNVNGLIPIIEAVRSASFVIDNIPLWLAKGHGTLRFDAIRAAPQDGLHMEFGVWKGAWITMMANEFPDRKFYGFDSFEGLPQNWSTLEPGYFDLGGIAPSVPSNVELIKGWFNASLPVFLASHPGPVSFIHMDCDLYLSTMTVLCLLRERLRVGTTIVFDDYMLEPGWKDAEHRAFHDFFAAAGVEFSFTGYSKEEPSVSASIVLTKV